MSKTCSYMWVGHRKTLLNLLSKLLTIWMFKLMKICMVDKQ
jgi:hypothetical protein